MSYEVGTIVKGKVTGITKFGAFVETADGKKGMVHISEVSRSYVEDISKELSVGQAVECKVISISDDGKFALSIKQVQADSSKPQPKRERRPKVAKKYTPAPKVTSPPDFEWQSSQQGGGSFEDMMSKFKKTSEDKMSDLKRGESRGYSRRGNGSGRK